MGLLRDSERCEVIESKSPIDTSDPVMTVSSANLPILVPSKHKGEEASRQRSESDIVSARPASVPVSKELIFPLQRRRVAGQSVAVVRRRCVYAHHSHQN